MRLFSSQKYRKPKLSFRLFGASDATAHVNTPPHTADWNTKFDALLGPRPVRLHYWPAYEANPYQMMFYGAQTDLFTSRPGTIEQALSDLRRATTGPVCFHLHWLNFLYGRIKGDTRDTETRTKELLDQLRAFVAEGGLFFWTVHNLTEHQREDGPFERNLRKILCDLAHRIFVHGRAAQIAFLQDQPNATEKTLVIDHGNYIGVYPDTLSRAAARDALNMDSDTTVFASVGWLRRYKGLDTLCAAVDSIEHARLLIAGRALKQDKESLLTLFSSYRKTQVHEGWVAPADIQRYMNAADFVVLPYLASLTSGAALLALSFGVPVIAPRLGAFPEVINDSISGYLYDPSSETGLRDALQRACATPAATRVDMGLKAFQTALSMNWATGRRTLFSQIAACTDQVPLRKSLSP